MLAKILQRECNGTHGHVTLLIRLGTRLGKIDSPNILIGTAKIAEITPYIKTFIVLSLLTFPGTKHMSATTDATTPMSPNNVFSLTIVYRLDSANINTPREYP